mgnify:CR=1 FL=1
MRKGLSSGCCKGRVRDETGVDFAPAVCFPGGASLDRMQEIFAPSVSDAQMKLDGKREGMEMYENGDYGGAGRPGYDWNRQQPGVFYANAQAPGPVGGSAWGGKKPARRSRGALGVAGFWVSASALLVNVVAVLLFRQGIHDLFEAPLADPSAFPDGDMAGLFFLIILMMLAGIWAVAGFSLGISGLVFSSKEGDARNKAYSILAIVLSVCNPIVISIMANYFVF